jgi:hypothetical protein
MRVLYLISTFEKGMGGHYYSLESTLKSLKPKVDAVVINIGRMESPVISSLDCPKYQFIYKYFNFIKIQKRIESIIQEHQIDRIHCFDDRAYWFIRNYRFKNIPVALTKCGGPNPKYFPKVDNLILFSEENKQKFKNRDGYKNTYLVPNRILPFSPNMEKVNSLKIKLNIEDDSMVFLRIARISHYYKESIFQSIRLVEQIPEAILIIVGQVIDQEVLNQIREKGLDRVHIVDEKEYYKNAKEIIPICNFYIGTGRGVMEATSLKKIVLSPVMKRNYPALVTEKTFRSFFNTNFSERNISQLSNSELLRELNEVIESKKRQKSLSNFSFQMFNENFNLKAKKDWYSQFYKNLSEASNTDFIDKCTHFLFFHYHYISQA